jgi:serine/threonine protein kinase
MDLYSIGVIVGCFLDTNRQPRMSPDNLLSNRNFSQSLECQRLPFLRDAVRRLCSNDPSERGNLKDILHLLHSRSRTQLQEQLQNERTWWNLNADDLKRMMDAILVEMRSQSSEVNTNLSELLVKFSTNMASESQEICLGLGEVLNCLKSGKGNDEVMKALTEIKRQIDALG